MQSYIIIYDDDCGFCEWCRELTETYDKENIFTWVGMSTQQALDLAQQAGKKINPQHPESFVCYDPHKNIWLEKSQALKKITAHTSGPLRVLYYVLVCVPRVLADYGYSLVARNRSTLGRWMGRTTCRIRN